MTSATRTRLIVFVVLSAVGIVYVASAYLGLVDKVLGRGFTVQATLTSSGGLYVGSEVDYRGVRIGKVSAMHATGDGVLLDLALDDQTKLPLGAPMYVHNLSAVGEQYLDFEPATTDGPYAAAGDTLVGNPHSLPVDEGDLLTTLNTFVGSVDKPALQTLIKELGVMFTGTAKPLQQILDEGGKFIDTASTHTDDTIRLLNAAESVLSTQQKHGSDITTFAKQLDLLTHSLRRSDGDLRTILDQTPDTAAQIQGLLTDLEPTLPVLLSDLVNVNSVVVSHLGGLEQLLVTFPRVIEGGFTGTTKDGYGHVNLQLDESQGPCTQGYEPAAQWRAPNDLTDGPIYPAHCDSGSPFVMRGADHVPGTSGNPSPGRTYSGSYDPRTGVVGGVVDAHGKPVRVADPGDLSIMGDDSWKWLVVGPVASP